MPEIFSIIPKEEVPKNRIVSERVVPESDMVLTEINNGIQRYEGPEREVILEVTATPVVSVDTASQTLKLNIKAGSFAEMIKTLRTTIHELVTRKRSVQTPPPADTYKMYRKDDRRDSVPHTMREVYRVRKVNGKEIYVWQRVVATEVDMGQVSDNDGK